MTEPLAHFLAGRLRPARPGAARRHRGEASAGAGRARSSDEQGPPFFVLSLKAGGTGLNLTAASHVDPLRSLVEPGGREPGDRPRLSHRAEEERAGPQVRLPRHRRGADRRADREQAGAGRTRSSRGRRGLLTEMTDEELLRLVALDLRAAGLLERKIDVGTVEGCGKAERATCPGGIDSSWSAWPAVRSGGGAPGARGAGDRQAHEEGGQEGLARRAREQFYRRHILGQGLVYENLERYSDYESRLPRGRSYVRSGAVVDLQIDPGKIAALVRGSSSLYRDDHHQTRRFRRCGRRS